MVATEGGRARTDVDGGRRASPNPNAATVTRSRVHDHRVRSSSTPCPPCRRTVSWKKGGPTGTLRLSSFAVRPSSITESSPLRSVSANFPDTCSRPKGVGPSVRFVPSSKCHVPPTPEACPSSSWPPCKRAFLWNQGRPTGSFPLSSPTVRALVDIESSPPRSVSAKSSGHLLAAQGVQQSVRFVGQPTRSAGHSPNITDAPHDAPMRPRPAAPDSPVNCFMM